MQMQSESLPQHAIQSYTPSSVRIDGKDYQQSLLLTANAILPELPITELNGLTHDLLMTWLKTTPKILIIGHEDPAVFLAPEIHLELMRAGIGVECMRIDAACRTFNILLSEERDVALILIYRVSGR